jgi:hypothetical protein
METSLHITQVIQKLFFYKFLLQIHLCGGWGGGSSLHLSLHCLHVGGGLLVGGLDGGRQTVGGALGKSGHLVASGHTVDVGFGVFDGLVHEELGVFETLVDGGGSDGCDFGGNIGSCLSDSESEGGGEESDEDESDCDFH